MESKPRTAKKVVAIIVAILLVLAIVFVIVRTFYLQNRTVQSAENAIAIALPAFVEKFGEEDGDIVWEAERDQWAGTWHVYGLFPMSNDGITLSITLGGTPEAIVREWDGEIIDIWHSK